MDRRLFLVWGFVPIAFYVHACSSDEASPSDPSDSGASSGTTSSGGSSGTTSGSSSGGDMDANAGEAGPTACVGNPLLADGGPDDDASVILSLDASTEIRTAVRTTGVFFDGPTYTDVFAGGALVYSQVFGAVASQVARVGPDGGAPTLVRLAPNGTFVIGNAVRGSAIVTTFADDPGVAGRVAGGILQTLPDGAAPPNIDKGAANDPNDLVVTNDGTIYFTDPGYQSINGGGNNNVGVYRSDGGPATLVKSFSTGANERPDGIALSADGTTLYVSFGPAQRIDKFTIAADGTVTPAAQPFAAGNAVFGTNAPEGLATDDGGNVWVAESPNDFNTNGGRVSVFSPAGKKYGEIRFPDHRPNGIAFGGGADNKALYIVANRVVTPGNYEGNIFIYPSRCSGVR